MFKVNRITIHLGFCPSANRKFGLVPQNFFNFMPFRASVGYLLEQGPSRVESHVRSLVGRLVTGLDPTRFDLISSL